MRKIKSEVGSDNAACLNHQCVLQCQHWRNTHFRHGRRRRLYPGLKSNLRWASAITVRGARRNAKHSWISKITDVSSLAAHVGKVNIWIWSLCGRNDCVTFGISASYFGSFPLLTRTERLGGAKFTLWNQPRAFSRRTQLSGKPLYISAQMSNNTVCVCNLQECKTHLKTQITDVSIQHCVGKVNIWICSPCGRSD